ncbi:hypothetical protein [Bradyrhizobium sp.]|uniref:hypothetical protein n=1 Tax=Bradyrhizobium sp. TaxID=376 RepID=UPI002639E767|nr:hypothetical protein [Bradyrhizobium sp.]
MPPRKPTAILQYKLRVRESLRRKIEKAAGQNNNSANQEMVNRLEATFRDDWIAEGSALITGIKSAFGKFDANVWKEACEHLDLTDAALALVEQVNRLPAKEKHPELMVALDRVTKAIHASTRTVAATLFKTPHHHPDPEHHESARHETRSAAT